MAYSGGRDSTALLHATCAAAAPLGLAVVALHVHHGLQPAADAWQRHARTLCARWRRRGAPLSYADRRLEGAPAAGESVEAWARAGRYRALAEMARAAGASVVLLAHHRRDQAETWCLQVLRGAGLRGQSAMPRVVERDGLTWMRPWLDRPAQDVVAYARRHRLSYVHDGSNDDPRHARNRLRLQVWPTLTEAFPQAEAAFAQAARWAQQAEHLLDGIAAEMLDGWGAGPALPLDRWAELDDARRSLVLRHWLRREAGRPAGATLVERLMQEAVGEGHARWDWVPDALERHRGALHFRAARPSSSACLSPPADAQAVLHVSGPGRHALPAWGGVLVVEAADAEGLLPPLALVPRARDGGERFQAGPGRPPRDLKRQFQSAGVPVSARDVPLFFQRDALVFVPGLGVDARHRAPAGVPQLRLRWEPGAAARPEPLPRSA